MALDFVKGSTNDFWAFSLSEFQFNPKYLLVEKLGEFRRRRRPNTFFIDSTENAKTCFASKQQKEHFRVTVLSEESNIQKSSFKKTFFPSFAFSVTRLGEFLPLWHTVKNFDHFKSIYLVFGIILAKFGKTIWYVWILET